MLNVLEGIVMDSSLGGWRRLSRGFWVFKSRVTLQVDVGLGYHSSPSLICSSERLPLD